MPHQIDKSALVMHSAERMFHIVNDVARYPEFLPWCAGTEIHQQTDSEVMASIEIAKGVSVIASPLATSCWCRRVSR